MKKRKQIRYQFRWIVMLMMLLSMSNAYSQIGTTISGIVQDSNGESLIGVSVLEQGTSNGTITDMNGKYSVKLTNEKAVLQFSYIGYAKQNVSVAGKKTLNVVLKDDAVGLEEVIITGYGKTVTKDKLTAAISKVSSDVLERGVRSNPLTALAGTVTGVRVTQTSGAPGSSPDILIRGGASLDGKGSPLYIIDGVQKSSMVDINSNDIESIEVLKDAAATALYGARANNGVVLVTTKTGKSGKTSVTLNVNVGKNILRENYKFLNARDYLYWERLGAYRSGQNMNLSNGWGTGNDLSADGNLKATGLWSTVILTDENRHLLNEGWDSMKDPVSDNHLLFKEFILQDENLQEAWTQDYNLSFSGGNDKAKFYSSIGFYNETGFPYNSEYKRLSFSLNGEYKISNWLTASGFINFSNSTVNPNPTGDSDFFSLLAAIPPTLRQYNPDGELIASVTNAANSNWKVLSEKYYRRDESYKSTIGTSFKIDITKHLNLKLNAMWYLHMQEKEAFDKERPNGPGKVDSNRAASASYGRRLDQTYNALLGYNNTFGKHGISAIAGFEMIDQYSFGLTASGQGASSDDFISLGYTAPADANGNPIRKIGSTHVRERIMSGFINASYDYESKYLLSFSGRYDGYSKLVDNRWGFFPGISAAWNIYREEFMSQSLDVVSNLKIRMGYGQNGNVNGIETAYQLQGDYGNPGNYNNIYGLLINKLPYPNLRWEKTTSMDVAVEAGLWNTLNMSVGYFNKNTSDLIASVPFPTSAGVGDMLTNNGKVRSQGLEIEASYKIFDEKDFKWSVGANMTLVRSKITELPDNGNDKNRQEGQEVYTGRDLTEKAWVGGKAEGERYGNIYGFQMVHIVRDDSDLQNYANYIDRIPGKNVYGPSAYAELTDAQKKNAQQLAPGDAIWQDVNGDGVIEEYDQVKLGTLVPKLMGGFNTLLSYKGLSLFARFDFATGYKKWNQGQQYFMGMNQGYFNTTEQVKDSWTPENTNPQYPILMYADGQYKRNYNRTSSLFYEDASYLCAREISLSYDLPTNWVRKALMQKATLSLTGQNLFYITNTTVFTPEYGTKKEDRGGYPLPISVLMGLKVAF